MNNDPAIKTQKENGATCYQATPPSLGIGIMDQVGSSCQSPISNPQILTKNGAPQAAGTALLGKDSKVCVPTPKNDDFIRENDHLLNNSFSVHRYLLQDKARELKPSSRVNRCYRTIAFDPSTRRQYDHVAVMQSGKSGRRYTANTWRCKNVWDCPVCLWVSSCRYLQQMIDVLTDQRNVKRYAYALQTLTVGHRATMDFYDLAKRFRKATRYFRSGRWYQSFCARWHIRGVFTSIDILHTDNGMHIHTHGLLIADRGGFSVMQNDGTEWWISEHFNDRVLIDIFAEAAPYWQRCADRAGLYASLEHGYDISRDDRNGNTAERVARYISKMAMEVSLAPAKRGDKTGRTLLELLDAALKGDDRAGKTWVEITNAMKGMSPIRASKGLWKLLGSADPDPNAGALDEDKQDQLLARLSKAGWYELLRIGKRQEWFEASQMSIEYLNAFCMQNDVSLETIK